MVADGLAPRAAPLLSLKLCEPAIEYHTYMAKLTLSVDARIVSRAKQYAKRRGVSVSQMVEDYLAAVAESPCATRRTAPILQSMRGILNNGDLGEYRQHLTARYR